MNEDSHSSATAGEAPRRINATEKILAVVEQLGTATQPRRLSEIASGSGLGKASTHRLLADFTRLGFAVRADGGRYSVGPRLLAVALSVQHNRSDVLLPILEKLQAAVGQTVHFSVHAGDEAVYVQKIESQHPFQMASRVGMHVPLYCTAAGKAILAFLDDESLNNFIDRVERVKRTPNTLVEPAELRAALERVRSLGYALDDEENELKVRCVGAPVFGRDGEVIGGISVSTLTFESSRHDVENLATTVIRAADEVSRCWPFESRRGPGGGTDSGVRQMRDRARDGSSPAQEVEST